MSICLFVTFYPHFLEWCVLQAERERRGAGRRENPQMYPHKLYQGPTINSRPSDDDDDDDDDGDNDEVGSLQSHWK